MASRTASSNLPLDASSKRPGFKTAPLQTSNEFVYIYIHPYIYIYTHLHIIDDLCHTHKDIYTHVCICKYASRKSRVDFQDGLSGPRKPQNQPCKWGLSGLGFRV